MLEPAGPKKALIATLHGGFVPRGAPTGARGAAVVDAVAVAFELGPERAADVVDAMTDGSSSPAPPRGGGGAAGAAPKAKPAPTTHHHHDVVQSLPAGHAYER